MKSKNFMSFIGSICLVLILVTLLLTVAFPRSAESASAEKPIELRWATSYGDNVMPTMKANWIAAEVAKRTGGKVKITVYPNQTLAKVPDFLNALASGIADGATLPIPVYPGKFPELGITELPFFIPNRGVATEVLAEFWHSGLVKSFDPYHVISMNATSAAFWYFRDKKVTSMEDLKGMKFRSPGGVNLQAVELLGVSPVGITVTEVPMALERGIIDGLNTMDEFFVPTKMYEFSKYSMRLPLFFGQHVEVMSQAAWEKVPPEYQVVLNQVGIEAMYWCLSKQDSSDTEYQNVLRNKNMELYLISPDEQARWKKTVHPIIDEWVKGMEAKGIPGKELLKKGEEILDRFQTNR